MSLTSYRAAPPRDQLSVIGRQFSERSDNRRLKTVGWFMDRKTWRRPTLPCLETQYHGRWGFSRPSSGRDRVRAPRQSHQVVRSMKQLSGSSGQAQGRVQSSVFRGARIDDWFRPPMAGRADSERFWLCDVPAMTMWRGRCCVSVASEDRRLKTDACPPT
jgi:hypothetical protein